MSGVSKVRSRSAYRRLTFFGKKDEFLLLTSIVPNTGLTEGGTEVTLTGANFQNGATVTFGGVPATGVVWVSATQLTAVTPAGNLGTVDVVVTNPDTKTSTLTGGYEYTESYLNLTITTTASPQTVTIQRLTPQVESVIDWGDGTTTTVPAAHAVPIVKIYATASVYQVKVTNRHRITSLDMRVSQIGGLNTSDLRRAPMTGTFRLFSLGAGCVINSADMTDWRPTSWQLYTMPAGTYNLSSAHMTDWRPTTFWLSSMSAGTYNFSSAHMTDWRPTAWHLLIMPAGSFTAAPAAFRNWKDIRTIRLDNNTLNLATVEAIINDIYEGRAGYTWATPTLSIGGVTNATPGGVYADPAPNPPASALEQVWVLANSHPWAITWSGGSAP